MKHLISGHKEIGIAPERIFRFGKEDNFWEHAQALVVHVLKSTTTEAKSMACGKPGCTVGCECDRYIEVWNNVFSQFR